ncbi:Sycp2 [Columba guinea]|nr:Sycp2 [Columba guinea]
MISEKQRRELACQWFSMEFVSNAFKEIKDSEFETLQIPLDENLEEFWIDFNVGSRSISFYVAAEDAKTKFKEITDATKSLINKISDRYKINADEKSKARDSLGFNRDDVYNFNISGFDEPTIKLGTRNNQNKKHLFSDTDTEYRGDDSKTDVSWLHESNRKPKAQLIDYSRNKNLGKPISTDKTADKFSAPACHVDKPKGKSANKKKVNKSKKQNATTDETIEQTTRQKRPRRAALAKNYKEPSTSESESERQSSACASKEEKSKRQKHMNGKNKDDYQQKELQNIVSVEPRGVAEYVHNAKSENSAEQMDIEVPSSESPASLEAMRCDERISEGDVTQEHAYSERSFNLQESTPEKEETLNFEEEISPDNFHPQKKNIPSKRLNQSSEMTVKKLTFGNKSFSPVLTEASLSRSRKVDHFTKQSLRVAHEHLTTMSYQIHECRIRQLDKFHFAILEELENFEKDSQSLKNMEKEFSVCILIA